MSTPPPPLPLLSTSAPRLSAMTAVQRLPYIQPPYPSPLPQLPPLQISSTSFQSSVLPRLSTLEPPLPTRCPPTSTFQPQNRTRDPESFDSVPIAGLSRRHQEDLASQAHAGLQFNVARLYSPEIRRMHVPLPPVTPHGTHPSSAQRQTSLPIASEPRSNKSSSRSHAHVPPKRSAIISTPQGHEPANKRLRRSSQPLPTLSPRPSTSDSSSAVGFNRAVTAGKLDYSLVIRQQPVAARACGFGERDRRVIDPPPILEMKVVDGETGEVNDEELRYLSYVVQASLYDETRMRDVTTITQPGRRAGRRLTGTLVSSPTVAVDENDRIGCFFTFSDLSCRTHGNYRLRFVLIRVDPTNLAPGSTTPVRADVMSRVFTVFTAKDFPGVQPSSQLIQALKRQGVTIAVKKGQHGASSKRLHDEAGGEEGEV